MSVPIKLGLGVLGLSAIAVPGIWMSITAEPGSKTLADSSSTEYAGKFGEDFKHHLVDATEGRNQSWWDWSFQYRWSVDKEDEKESNFKGVTSGSLLRDKCAEAYKKTNKSDIHGNSKDSYEKSVWRYCSLEGQKPITLSESIKNEESSETGKIKITKKKDLISTEDIRNSKFWEIQNRAFFSGLGTKATEENSVFKKLYESKVGPLKDTCAKAYEETTTNINDQKNTLLFCSLLIKEEQ